MATQIELTNDGKIKIMRKGVLTSVQCCHDGDCLTACIGCSEPIYDQGNTFLTISCENGQMQFCVPDVDFADNR
jgi:hypothetical protein